MIIFSENIHYLDPGTGSYLYQALLAAGITAGIYFRNLKIFATSWMNKIKNLIKKEN
tara:strand:- start:531 stop:701 length:171 start_codon:yes stop_codon:yes gene_type:complete